MAARIKKYPTGAFKGKRRPVPKDAVSCVDWVSRICGDLIDFCQFGEFAGQRHTDAEWRVLFAGSARRRKRK